MRTFSKHAVSILLTLTMLVSMVIVPSVMQVAAADPTMAGDVDGDGKISSTDALEVLKAVVGKVTFTQAQKTYSDVDADGKLAAADALTILKKVVGKIDKFPLEDKLNAGPSEPITITLATVAEDETAGKDYTGDHATGMLWKEQFAQMQANNITTVVTPLSLKDTVDTIKTNALAGTSPADVYELSLAACRALAKENVSLNLYKSNTLKKDLFANAATESMTHYDRAFGVSFATKAANPMGVIYNKQLIAQYAPDYDIAKLYADGQWTFAKFQEIANACIQDTDGDGKTDIYGFTSNTDVIGMALTSNAGATALKVDEKVEATMCNDKGIAALNWCKDLFSTDKSWLYKPAINTCIGEFQQGHAAMFVSYLQFLPQLATGTEFEMGFVQMPMGPDQDKYITGVYDATMFAVPTDKRDRLDDIGYWLNAMAGASDALVEHQVNGLKASRLDDDGIATYRKLVNGMSANFSTGVFSQNTSSAVDSSVTAAAKKPDKVIPNLRETAQKECDDYFATIYTYDPQ